MVRSKWGLITVVILAAMFLFFNESTAAEDTAKQAATQQQATPDATAKALPDNTPKQTKLLNEAQGLITKGDNAAAVGILEKAQKMAPQDSAIMRTLIDTYLATNAQDKAENLLTQIVTSEGYKDIRDWANIEYYNLASKKEGIEAALKKLEAAGKKSKSIDVQRSIAEGYVRLRDWGKGAEIYQNLLKDNANDSVLTTRFIDACMLNKDYDPVIKVLEPKVAANPNDTGSSDILAHAYTQSNQADKAIALYKVKIEKEPNSPGLRGRYAQALMDLGMPEQSLAEWDTAFKLDPSNFLFKQRVAEIYTQLGKTKEARKAYAELLAVIPPAQASLKETINSRIKEIDAAAKKK